MKLVYGVKDKPKFAQLIILAFQQLLSIITATLVVPVIINGACVTNMSSAAALFGAGIGTLCYILFTKKKSPVFLGSSFAFINSMIAAFAGATSMSLGFLGLIIGAVCAGLVYVAIAIIVKFAGVNWVNKLMPAAVIGPTVAIIGLSLAGNAIGDMSKGSIPDVAVSPLITVLCGLITLVIVILCSTYGKKMAKLIPFIMVNRNGACNLVKDSFECTKVEKYVKEKQAEGMTNITIMHVMIAAYIRCVSQRPGLNRFIRGQRIWTRRHVEVSLTIKKEMSLDSPDTVVKITVPRDATLQVVYEELNRVITEYRDNPGGDFDETAKVLSYFPSVILKFVVWLLKLLDYFNLLPKFLTNLSPFHCSFFITSMGSLGIPPVFHHLYDFGTCPVFVSFGAKQRSYEVNPDGSVYKHSYMDMTVVTDERICDGYYFASSLKLMKGILRNPWQLDEKPETVQQDIR